ncbi:MAG: hypothetical protein K2K14_00980 [Ruminococcus sp.]|nr:hypothetical protein [Ruminococcus sp.]
MGAFDKKKAFGIGGLVTVLSGLIAVLANLSEIAQFFNKDKPEKSVTTTSIVETVEKNTKAKETKQVEETIVEAENVAEVVEEVPETEPPTKPQSKFVYLSNMKVTESNYEFNLQNGVDAIDTIGNRYSGYVITVGNPILIEEGYATYYLGGKYKTLSGTIAVHDDTYGDDVGELSILCDENIVYGTGIIGRTSVPTEFSVNIEDCQWLKICRNKSTVKFILSDWKLEE